MEEKEQKSIFSSYFFISNYLEREKRRQILISKFRLCSLKLTILDFIIMDELIIRAIDSIDKTLQACRSRMWIPAEIKTRLNDTRHLLTRLSKSDLLKNDQARLFCRQLKRLMDYNDVLPHEFWSEIYSDILYLFEVGKDEQCMSNSWNRFIMRMNFEKTLEQRQLQDQNIRKERKSLNDFLHEHKEFFDAYLQTCISLHSTVQVQSLIENTDDFLEKIFENSNMQMRLTEPLKCITMPLEFSNRALCSLDRNLFEINDAYTEINTKLGDFLPSRQPNVKNIGATKTIESILGLNRWIVILGDPGSAKTTLLRWITQIFAKAASCKKEKVDFDLPVRIPILIRISEFVEWISQNRTGTLIDYIGKQTWFSQRYCSDEHSSILKELIYQGHALILLDGLDEVLESEQRKTIVDLVERFIDEYVRANNFISAFDSMMFDTCLSSTNREILETRPPSKPDGNQIIVTSRIVGYQFRPLNGPFIRHYSLLLMDQQQANQFVKLWLTNAVTSVQDILLNQDIQVDEQILQTWLKKMYDIEQAIFENNLDLLQSNPLLLSLICTFIFQSSLDFYPKCRVQVYNHAVQTTLRTWINNESIENFETILIDFFIDFATYLHLRSPSGLIDAFDVEHLCVQTLKKHKLTNDRMKLNEYTRRIISLLESNTILVVEKGLQTFGFLHSSFQEYFVAQGLINDSSVESTTTRILSLTTNSRFREALRLAFGWISWKWSTDQYEQFCNLLLTQTKDLFIPFGVLLFFDTINDLYCLPSNSIIFNALNCLLHHELIDIREKFLISNLSKLPENIITEWMQFYLTDDKNLADFCLLLLRELDQEQKALENVSLKPISSVIFQQLGLLHSRNLSTEFIIDQVLRRKITSDDLTDQIFNKDLYIDLILNVHPLIFSAVIATCGGIYAQCKDGTIRLNFSLKKMHRHSSIINLITKYSNPNELQIQTFITECESILERSSPNDISIDIIDTLVALICLQGFSHVEIYQKYYAYQAFPLALNQLKRTWFYIKKSSFFQRDLKISSMRSDIASFIKVSSLLNDDQPENQYNSLSSVCNSIWKNFTAWSMSWSTLGPFLEPNGSINLPYNRFPKPIDNISIEKFDSIPQYMNTLEILVQKPLFLVNFLPSSLRQLYYYTTICPINENDQLSLAVFLSQCLIYLDEVNKNQANDCFALFALQQLFKDNMFESYSSILCQEKSSHMKDYDKESRNILQAMKYRLFSHESDCWKKSIEVERQRIHQATDRVQVTFIESRFT